ncbi:MAG: PKD domain-containing protein, partial [Bacteroidota bacterium]
MKSLASFFVAGLCLLGQLFAQTPCDSVQVSITPDTVCMGDPMVFNLGLDPEFSQFIDSATWDFGDGTTSDFLTAVHTFGTTGTQSVAVTVYLSEEVNPCILELNPVINDTPHVEILANDTSGCSPFLLTFTNNSFTTQGPALTYEWTPSPTLGWQFVNGTDASSTEPEIQFDSAGIYTVSVLVSNDCDSTIVPFTISVSEEPTAGLSLSTDTLCLGDPVILTFTGGFPAEDSLLIPGDASGDILNPIAPFSFTYQSVGTYQILYLANNACGSDTSQAAITILDAPTATLTASTTTICEGGTVDFSFAGGFPANDSTFDPGDGSPLISDPVGPLTHTYVNPGTYTAYYEASNDCGTAIDSVIIEVESLPVITMSLGQDSICTSSSTVLNVGYAPIDPADIDTLFIISPGQTDTITPAPGFPFPMPMDSGQHVAIYTVSNGCGSVSESVTLEVVGPPEVVIEPFIFSCAIGIGPDTIGENIWRQCNGTAGTTFPLCLEIGDYNSNYIYEWTFTYQGSIIDTISGVGVSEFNWNFEFGATEFCVTVTDPTTGCQDDWCGTFFYQSNPEFDIAFCLDPITCPWSPPNVCEGDTVYIVPNVDSTKLANLDTICIDWGDNSGLEYYFKEDGYPSVFKHAYQVENDSNYVCQPFVTQLPYTITGIGKNSCGT